MTQDDIIRIIRKTRTLSVLRASDEGKRLAERNPELGYDTVSLTFKLPPAEADYVLRFLGRQDGGSMSRRMSCDYCGADRSDFR